MTDFDDIHNKTLLWSIMTKNKDFLKLSNENMNSLFNTCVQEVVVDVDYKNKTILELNKLFVQMAVRKIKENQMLSSYTTSEDIRKSNLKMFDTNLSSMEAEFKDFLTLKKPTDVKFSDELVDKPIENMDKMLAQILLDRQEFDIIHVKENDNILTTTVQPMKSIHAERQSFQTIVNEIKTELKTIWEKLAIIEKESMLYSDDTM